MYNSQDYHQNGTQEHRKHRSVASGNSASLPLKKVRKKDTIEMLLSKPPLIVQSSLSQLRYQILVDGLKVSEDVSYFLENER